MTSFFPFFISFFSPSCLLHLERAKEKRDGDDREVEKQNGNGVRDTILLVYDIVYFLKDLPHLSICSFKSFQNTFICVCALYLHNE